MSVDTTVQLLIALMPFLIALAGVAYKVALARLPAARRAEVEQAIGVLVRGAEQSYKNVPGSGAYKKTQVLHLLQNLGLLKGIDPKLVDALIEAAVASLPHNA